MHDGLIRGGDFDQELAGQRELVHQGAMLPCWALVCHGPSRARFELIIPDFKIRLWLRIDKCGHTLFHVNMLRNVNRGSIWFRDIDRNTQSALL